MKHVLTIILTLSFCIGFAIAQPGGGMGGPGRMGGGGPGMMGGPGGFGGNEGFGTIMQDPAEMAQKYVDKIKEGMEISPKQEKSLVKLYTSHFNKLQILTAQISDLEKATDQRITSEILLPEQLDQWKEVKKHLRRQLRAGNGRQMSQDGATSPREGEGMRRRPEGM